MSNIVDRHGVGSRGHAGLSRAVRFFDLPATAKVTKRVFDVMAASAILFLCAPLLGVIALSIRAGSRGPALYKQTRVGLGGRPFVMYKFRSMYDGVESAPHRRYVEKLILKSRGLGPEGGPSPWVDLTDDPRITPAGRMLRRLGLDELPQLLNVLRGDMSLVGPRPALPYEVELYEVWHRQRLAALPGITGFWQVRAGKRFSFDDMVRMDLDYLRRRSLWLDVKLLLQTPWAVLVDRRIR